MTPTWEGGTSPDELAPQSPKCASPQFPQVPSIFSLQERILLRMSQKGTLTYPSHGLESSLSPWYILISQVGHQWALIQRALAWEYCDPPFSSSKNPFRCSFWDSVSLFIRHRIHPAFSKVYLEKFRLHRSIKSLLKKIKVSPGCIKSVLFI